MNYVMNNADFHSELAPFGTGLHIAAAPGVFDHPLTLDREPGEDDARYNARNALLTALLDYAKGD